ARRRFSASLAALVALCGCVAGGDIGWDAALAVGPPGGAAGQYLDLYSADATDGAGSRYYLRGQPVGAADVAEAPAPSFALAMRPRAGDRALRQVADGRCGDRLV